MKVEYEPIRDLLYIWFGVVETKSARTITVAPGVYADFDVNDRLIGLEVLDAKEVLGKKVQFEVDFLPLELAGTTERIRKLDTNHTDSTEKMRKTASYTIS